MGRRKITIPIHGPLLREILSSSGLSMQKIAEQLKVSRMQVHTWITTERIPPRRLADLVRDFGVEAHTVRALSRGCLTEAEQKQKIYLLEQKIKTLEKAIRVLTGEE